MEFEREGGRRLACGVRGIACCGSVSYALQVVFQMHWNLGKEGHRRFLRMKLTPEECILGP